MDCKLTLSLSLSLSLEFSKWQQTANSSFAGLNLKRYIQKQPPEVIGKKGDLKKIAKFTGKHLSQSLRVSF